MQFEERPAVFEVNEVGCRNHAFVIHHDPGLVPLYAKRWAILFVFLGAFFGLIAGFIHAIQSGDGASMFVWTGFGAIVAGGGVYAIAKAWTEGMLRDSNRIMYNNEGFRVNERAIRWRDIDGFYVKSPDERIIVGKSANEIQTKAELAKGLMHFDWKVCVNFGHSAVIVLKRLTEIQAYEIAEALNDLQKQNLKAAA